MYFLFPSLFQFSSIYCVYIFFFILFYRRINRVDGLREIRSLFIFLLFSFLFSSFLSLFLPFCLRFYVKEKKKKKEQRKRKRKERRNEKMETKVKGKIDLISTFDYYCTKLPKVPVSWTVPRVNENEIDSFLFFRLVPFSLFFLLYNLSTN